MADISKAQAARAVAVLDRVCDFAGYGVMSRRALITRVLQNGGKVEAATVPDEAKRAKMQEHCDFLGRTCPFGNPNYPTTKEWLELREQLKQPITKQEYRLYHSEFSFWVIGKFEYEFAKEEPIR